MHESESDIAFPLEPVSKRATDARTIELANASFEEGASPWQMRTYLSVTVKACIRGRMVERDKCGPVVNASTEGR